jgi:hypothetical protein
VIPKATADRRYVRVHEWDNLKRNQSSRTLAYSAFANERALIITARLKSLLRQIVRSRCRESNHSVVIRARWVHCPPV